MFSWERPVMELPELQEEDCLIAEKEEEEEEEKGEKQEEILSLLPAGGSTQLTLKKGSQVRADEAGGGVG